MYNYTIEFDKRISFNQAKKLFTILNGCESFVITSGHYKLTKASLLIFLSLVGLNDFSLSISCSSKEKLEHIKSELFVLNKKVCC